MTEPVTQWFSGKPLVIGVWEVEGPKYQRIYGLRCFQFWNGEHFCMYAPSPNGASGMKAFKSANQNWKYRGISVQ